jgi:hypothetical protein
MVLWPDHQLLPLDSNHGVEAAGKPCGVYWISVGTRHFSEV